MQAVIFLTDDEQVIRSSIGRLGKAFTSLDMNP